MSVNYLGVVRVTKQFLPLLIRQPGSRVVNITSVAGRICFAAMGPYSASKYAAEAFSDTLRLELRPFGIHVSIIEPSFMSTPLVAAAEERTLKLWRSLPSEKRDFYGEEYCQILVQRLSKAINFLSGNPIQVVTAVSHAILSSKPKTRYVVGKDAKLFWIPVSCLPSFVSDGLFALLQRRMPQPHFLKGL